MVVPGDGVSQPPCLAVRDGRDKGIVHENLDGAEEQVPPIFQGDQDVIGMVRQFLGWNGEVGGAQCRVAIKKPPALLRRVVAGNAQTWWGEQDVEVGDGVVPVISTVAAHADGGHDLRAKPGSDDPVQLRVGVGLVHGNGADNSVIVADAEP